MNKQPEPANTTVLSPLPEPFEREKAQKKESYHVELPSEPLSSSSFKILKEELLKDLDDLKTMNKTDIQNLLFTAENYRKSWLQLRETEQKFIGELKRLGARELEDPIGSLFFNVGEIQENLSQLQLEWQGKLWDEFVLPLTNLNTDGEKQELGNFEKELKNKMNWLKTEVKATMTKKKTSKQPEQVKIHEKELEQLKKKYQILKDGIKKFKQKRFYNWLKCLLRTLDYQRVFHERSLSVLVDPKLKEMMNTPEPSLEAFEEIGHVQLHVSSTNVHLLGEENKEDSSKSASKRRSQLFTFRKSSTFNLGKDSELIQQQPAQQPTNSHSSNPKRVVEHSNKFNGAMYIRESKRAPWVKYWFVLENESLSYFKNEKEANSKAPPIGSILLPRCDIKAGSEKNTFEIQTPAVPIATTYYILCNSKDESESWQAALKTAIRMCSNSFRVLKEAAVSSINTITRAEQGQFGNGESDDRRYSTTSSISSLSSTEEREDLQVEEVTPKGKRSESTSSSKSLDGEKPKTFNSNADRRPTGWKDVKRGSGNSVPAKPEEKEKEPSKVNESAQNKGHTSPIPPKPSKPLPAIRINSYPPPIGESEPTADPKVTTTNTTTNTNSKSIRKSSSFMEQLQEKKNQLGKEKKENSKPSPPEKLSPIDRVKSFEEEEDDWDQEWVELITDSGDYFYFNNKTEETSRVKPPGFKPRKKKTTH